MKYRLSVALKWVLLAAFFAWSTIIFILIVGEDDPETQWTLSDFFLIKILAICAAYITYRAAVWCYGQDLCPKCIYVYIKKCEEDEEDQ